MRENQPKTISRNKFRRLRRLYVPWIRITFLFVLFSSFVVQAQDCQPVANNLSRNQNFILTSIPRTAGYNPAATGYSTCDVMQSVQYFDGLDRPLQTVQIKGSTQLNDVVQPFAYDLFGREVTKYLPYTTVVNDGSYKPGALAGTNGYANSEQNSFYTQPPANSGVSVNPYPIAQTNLEASPLNRVLEEGAPGLAWQLSTSGLSGSGHTVKMIYTTNDITHYWANEYLVNIDANNNRTLTFQGGYAADQLDVTVSQDENWTSTQTDPRLNTTEEYKDKEGHVILKRTYNSVTVNGVTSTQVLSTYYVYDNLNNLAYVLTPASVADASAGITSANNQATLDNLCYQYNYDYRNRLSQKKLPGKGWEYMVYNQLDELVLSQNANQRVTNQWTVTKYDAKDRVIMTGLWNAGAVYTQATLQASIYAAAQYDGVDYSNNHTANPYGYVITSYPALSSVLTVNYYDGYANIPNLPGYSVPAAASTKTTGLLTATLTNVLGSTNMLWTTHYYDDLGRDILTYKQHYLGATASLNNFDAVTTNYNFSNQPTSVTRQHWNTTNYTAPIVTISNQYTYDHMGRKTQTFEQINSGTDVLLAQSDFNEIGQLMAKHLYSTNAGTSFMQNIPYSYNERGWLLNAGTGTLFTEQLQYNNNTIGLPVFTPQYNGNIASQTTVNNGAAANTSTFLYDNLNRLLSATNTNGFTENKIAYDVMGNITALNRYQTSANTLIDQLSYTYTNAAGSYTNQLQTITDGSGNNTGIKAGTSSYTYDANGNTITDQSRSTGNIAIGYNLLNLPQNITGAKTITYTYDADGTKLRRVSPATGNTDYISGIEYDATGTNAPTITFIQTDEGKATPSGNTYIYDYYLTDHLGNTRVTFDTHTTTPTVLQSDDYYAFGMEISNSLSGAKNEYLYNKKELQEELGQYDYGARLYDPVIARWNTIDPLAEISRRWSPYNYVMNNPIRLIDPDGRTSTNFSVQNVTSNFEDEHGNFLFHIDDGSNAVFRETGSGTGVHFIFDRFEQQVDADGTIGVDEINTTTAIHIQQLLNDVNPNLKPVPYYDKKKKLHHKTFCNFALQNILNMLTSYSDNSLYLAGTANTIYGEIANNPNYQEVDYETAVQMAQNGGLAVMVYFDPSTNSPHGHVLTFDVSDNAPNGQVANVGASNGFMTINKAISSDKPRKYYVLVNQQEN